MNLELRFKNNPSDSTVYGLISAYGNKIANISDANAKQKLIIKAIEVCNYASKTELKNVFAIELLKLNPNHAYNRSIIWDLGEQLLSENKLEAASVIFKGYKKRYKYVDELHNPDKYILSEQTDLESYIRDLFLELTQNLKEPEKNKEILLKYIQIFESFALSFPENVNTPEYLFKVAEVYKILNEYNKMIVTFDWIYKYFPNYHKASLALFMKGFIIDTDLNMPTEARKSYELFLKNHPQDSLANDVKFLLKNLGKSDIDVLNELGKF